MISSGMGFLFGRGKLFGPFGSPRSILSLGVLVCFVIMPFIYLARLGGIWWYAAAALLAPGAMWLVWLDANKVPLAAALPVLAPSRDWYAYARQFLDSTQATDILVLMDEESSYGGLDLSTDELASVRGFIDALATERDRLQVTQPAAPVN
jgi:hypothetical protein